MVASTKMITVFWLVTMGLFFFSSSLSAQDKNKQPNIIIVFTDDQGYQDVGVFGSPNIKTPNLDKMASEGIRFTDFYSASPVCSPSRAALLTGHYPVRVGVPKVLWPNSERGLTQDKITIADILKQQNYATACIGKWHLGVQPGELPVEQGFDTYYGIPYSNDMFANPDLRVANEVSWRQGQTIDSFRKGDKRKYFVPLMKNNEVVEYPANQSTITRRYTAEAVNFIKTNRQRPFFLYLAHTMPHVPLYVSDEFRGKSARGLYGDAIEEIDWSMGEILKTLASLQLEGNTLVIFTSDNGPWNLPDGQGGSAFPLRGFKFSTFEGGMREPMIAQWKGVIRPGAVSSQIASTIDFFPTIAYLTKSSVPVKELDGKNIWPLFVEKNAVSPHETEGFFYFKETALEAIRSGFWKLRKADDKIALYNLKDDISESTNLASAHPDIVADLLKKMAAYEEKIKTK